VTVTLALALLGLVVGGVIAEFGGALGGAALGYAIGLHLAFKHRLAALEDEVARLARTRAFAPVAETPEPRWQSPPKPDLLRDMAPPAPAPAASRPLFEPQNEATVAPPPLVPAEVPQAPVADRGTPADSGPPALVAWLRDYFSGGNLVVRSGIIVLFFGVAFLLKFAADRNMLPIELRLAGVALGGVALLAIGWRLRLRQRAYALALQGGGVGLLYLTVFAALRLYELLPPTLTFALLVAVAALSAFLAIGQNSMALAALGATGGFLAPVLASTGQGNHVVLFSFYALLNAGIVAIAWFKAWRPLNLLAFVFTYGIGTAWGVLRYSPENFASTEPFVLLFFAMFVTVAVLFALRRAPDLKDHVDGTLVFGTPVMTMLLQSALVKDRPYAMAFSALFLGAVYLGLTAGAWRLQREKLRLLASAFLALGVAFLTLAVPLALDGHWTAATWALEGAAILWIGLRQQRRLAIASGILLQLGAAISFVVRYDVIPGQWPLANSGFLGALLIAAAALASAHVLRAHVIDEDWRWAKTAPVYWALLWWFVAGVGEIDRSLPADAFWPALLGFSTVTALGCAALARWHDWREFQWPTLLLLPAMIVAGLVSLQDGHFLRGAGVVAWPVALVAWLWLLHHRERRGYATLDEPVHIATLWLLVAMISLELYWQVKTARVGAVAWRYAMVALPAILALFLVRVRRDAWPVRAWPRAYLFVGSAGLAAWLLLWSLAATSDDASASPLPYLPLVNPLELCQAMALAAIAGWLLHVYREGPSELRHPDVVRACVAALAFAVFALLTTLLLRVIHHYVGVDYEPGALMRSTLVQAALSIFWGLIALTGMVAGARLGLRVVWFAAAVLLGVVLAKMFLVDLSRTATVARIVSFIGVGVLMLVIGRFSPVPPGRPAEVR
jgi:uncharacterized membrane protein